MELQKAENRLCSSTFFAAGDAGCSVYSVKSLTTIPFEVIPVPGVEWSAESILIQGIASNNALSLYLQSNERMSTDRLPSIMLHKQRNKWFYAGTHPRVLDSINLSLDEITNIVRETVPGCTVQIFELIDSWKGSPAKVLLLFSSLEYPEPERKGLERLIKKNIDLELGSLYYIDRIEFFPFMPPFKGGEIDVRKCLGQYQMGLLQKKKQYSFFEELHNLKKLIHEL